MGGLGKKLCSKMLAREVSSHVTWATAGVAALLFVAMVQQTGRVSSRTVLGQDDDWVVKHWTPGLPAYSRKPPARNFCVCVCLRMYVCVCACVHVCVCLCV